MEAIFTVILVYVGYLVVMSLLGAGARATGRIVKKITTGKDTYFGPAQLKLVDETIELENSAISFKKIMMRGEIPVAKKMDVGLSISAFDITDSEDGAFVISLTDETKESNSPCFGITKDIGNVTVGDNFTDWVQLGAIVPELIQGPCSGNRKIQLLIRLFDSNNSPTINCGYHSGGDVFFARTIEFDYSFTEKGYEEAVQDREESQSLSLKIGVAVAMADGVLDDAEGNILKEWIIKQISVFSDEKQTRLKTLFNDSLQEGFQLAKDGDLALTPLVERLAEIGEKKSKYDAIELCMDVMAADGTADPEEMQIIRTVAKALDLNMEEIEKMREAVTLDLSSSLSSEEGLESLVGLEASWSNLEKQKHLRKEFQKWSNRLNALPEGEERESAQNMLDSIAVLRRKYD